VRESMIRNEERQKRNIKIAQQIVSISVEHGLTISEFMEVLKIVERIPFKQKLDYASGLNSESSKPKTLS